MRVIVVHRACTLCNPTSKKFQKNRETFTIIGWRRLQRIRLLRAIALINVLTLATANAGVLLLRVARGIPTRHGAAQSRDCMACAFSLAYPRTRTQALARLQLREHRYPMYIHEPLATRMQFGRPGAAVQHGKHRRSRMQPRRRIRTAARASGVAAGAGHSCTISYLLML